MQEYWEAYMKPIEGHPAMVSFNAGVSDNVPDMEYIYVGFVKVKLQNPKEDGLVTGVLKISCQPDKIISRIDNGRKSRI